MSSSLRDAIIAFSEDYDKVGWQSVTTLIDSPRAQLLQQRHADEITEDVSDLIWLFFGNMGHLIAERNASAGAMSEQRFIEEVCGKQVSFKPDLLTKDPERPGYWRLHDFKITSVYVLKDAVNNGRVKHEWECQLNVYAYLLQLVGIKVSSICLEIIGRDWRQSEAMREHDYPSSQFHAQKVPMWDMQETKEYIEERVKLFEKCEKMKDSDLPHCSESERWADPDRWAVVKVNGKVGVQGYKKALPKASGFRTRADALAFLSNRKDHKELEIEYRKGESRRCERGYCKAAPFCSQYQEEINPPF
jgi:hypothetical protein